MFLTDTNVDKDLTGDFNLETLLESGEVPNLVAPLELDWYPGHSSTHLGSPMLGVLESISPGELISPIFREDSSPAAPSRNATRIRTGRHHCPHSACPQSSVSPKDLRRHINDRHNPQPPIFRCQSCPSKSFKRKDNLRRHLRNVHNIPQAELDTYC